MKKRSYKNETFITKILKGLRPSTVIILAPNCKPMLDLTYASEKEIGTIKRKKIGHNDFST